MNQLLRFCCLLILTLLALTCFATNANARAGGGGGFSSGGSSDGGSSSSGGGGSDSSSDSSGSRRRTRSSGGTSRPLTPIERLLIAALIVALILIFIISLILKYYSRYHIPQVISRGHAISHDFTEQNAIRTLSLADFNFNPVVFYGRVSTAFLSLQEGWSNQDISIIRPFASDGIVERFTLQFQAQKDRGIRNLMSSIHIASCRLVHASASPDFLTATVAISASAIDCDIDASGHTVRGNPRQPESFTEFWTFIRRPAPLSASFASSSSGGAFGGGGGLGLIEGHCPNCAAAIDDHSARSLKCASCGSLLIAGSHDWVLAEISQTSTKGTAAYQDDTASNPSILQYQANHDRGFTVAHIEDRASVIFWRWAKAQRLANVLPLHKIADASFSHHVAMNFANLEDRGSNLRRYLGNLSVGGVQAVGVVHGSDFDRAIVKVEWSATTLAVPLSSNSHANPQSLDGEGVYCVSVLTLIRKRGITTNPDFGLSSAHCPGCGSPESDHAHDACQYCGRVLNDGSGDWLLTAMDPEESPASNDAFAQLIREGYLPDSQAVVPGALSTLGPAIWLARVIIEDNVVTDRERDLFIRFCNNQNIPAEQMRAIVDTASREKRHGSPIKDHPDPDQAKRWLLRLAQIIFSTGYFGPEDSKLFRLTALRLGLTDAQAKQIESTARADALAKARALIKSRRG